MNQALRNGLFGAGYLVAYVDLDALSFVDPLLKLGITPWNPDAGITLAFLLTRGWRQAPWTAAAALSAEFLVHGAPAPLSTLLCAAAVIAAGYGVLAYVLSHRNLDHALATRRAALEFSFGAAVTALVVATCYAALFMMAGVLPVSAAAEAIARNWVGDLNGILTLTPLLLARPYAARLWPALRAHRGLIAGQAAVLSALLWLVLRSRPAGDLPLAYVLFVPVVWVTFTWGVIGASAVTLVIQIAFMTLAASRAGSSEVLEIHYLLVTLGLTALIIAAILAERAAALARVAANEAEQRERDTALSRAMRFAMAGELATALTHELNQPITAVVSYLKAVEILAAPLETLDSRLIETLHKATRESLRASDILKRLRDFYSGAPPNVTEVDLDALVGEALASFTERAERLGVRLTREGTVTRHVFTDRIQLQMVLHNLLANALDAVSDIAAGERSVHMTVATDGERLRISVADSGQGVPLEIRPQLFAPFVTSKPDGMGMGLAISRSLLRSQGGELRLDPSGAPGARFLVELPLASRTMVAV